MKAVVLRQFGKVDQLKVEEVPTPHASEHEVLVRVLAAGVNPSDVKNVQGGMTGTTLPRIPGRDFAGIVAEGPPEWVGKQVWGTGGDVGFTRDGSHAQYIALPETALIAKPDNLSMEAAGSAGVTFVTAWSALVSGAAIRPEDRVLILGAAGGVGSAAVQIARWFGCPVIAAVRTTKQEQQVQEFGLVDTVNTSTASFVEQIRARTDGHGADVVFDTTGHLFPDGVESAASGARVCVILAPSDGMVTFNLRSLYRKELRVIGTDSRRLGVVACARLLAEMAPGFQGRQLRPGEPHSFPLDRAIDAYRMVMEAGGRASLSPRS